MTYPFVHMMSDAARLIRSGKLQEATAAIRAALGGVSSRSSEGEPIDIDARVVDRPQRSGPYGLRPKPAESVASEGCFFSDSFRNKFGARDYKLYVPPQYRGSALPLVVMLHGCTQDPDDFARGTGMNGVAREHGVFVLYPAQAQGANTSRCWNWFKHNHQRRDSGEPGLLAGMVQEVAAKYSVDRTRIYVAGLSAGGAMAAILGDAYPELFAAVGVHSGLPSGTATNVGSAFAAMNTGAAAKPRTSHSVMVPTIVFHGDADTTVHPLNSERVLDACGAAGGVAGRHRERSANGREATRYIYRDANDVIQAERWVIHGAGHAWSGGSPEGTYTDPKGPDASAQMVRFFLAHRLPQRQ